MTRTVPTGKIDHAVNLSEGKGALKPPHPRSRKPYNVGALIVRIGFWGFLIIIIV